MNVFLRVIFIIALMPSTVASLWKNKIGKWMQSYTLGKLIRV